MDIGFTSLSNSMDHLEAITIVRDRLVAIVPFHHHLAINEQVKAEELQGEAFIMPQLGCEVSVKKFYRNKKFPQTYSLMWRKIKQSLQWYVKD